MINLLPKKEVIIDEKFHVIYDYLKGINNKTPEVQDLLDNELFINEALKMVKVIDKAMSVRKRGFLFVAITAFTYKSMIKGSKVIESLATHYAKASEATRHDSKHLSKNHELAQDCLNTIHTFESKAKHLEKVAYLSFVSRILHGFIYYIEEINRLSKMNEIIETTIQAQKKIHNIEIDEIIFKPKESSTPFVIASIPNSEKVHVIYLDSPRYHTIYATNIKRRISELSGSHFKLTQLIENTLKEQNKGKFVY